MKNHLGCFLSFLCLFGGAGFLQGAPADANQQATTSTNTLPAPTPFAVTKRDANSCVWSQTAYEQSPLGKIVAKEHHVTELASGLNHLVNGQWVESKEWIDILPNGTAAATNGQHQAYFPGDIYQGQIEVVTPDGQHLKSRPVGLSYFDGTNSVLIAELTNSIGQVSGDNQVIYTNAFTDLKADLRYTYTKAGFEQDIILRQQPPTPESLGLNPDTARLEVLTEFFSPPQPTVQSKQLAPQAGLALNDQSLGFGSMQMIPGRAFILGKNARNANAKVAKNWLLLDGRQFLVEEVPVDAIWEGLAALPLTAMGTGSSKTSHTASKHMALPPERLAHNTTSQNMMVARAQQPTKGFVLDYQMVSGSLTNYTFQGDTTYYLSGPTILYGASTFEGGTVIKFSTNGAPILLNPSGAPTGTNCPFNFKSIPYRPAIFTSKDDDSVGEAISDSTGNPVAGAGSYYIESGVSGSEIIHDARFSYANTAWFTDNEYAPVFRDCQFFKCSFITALVSASDIYFKNVLGVQSGTWAVGAYLHGENITADGCDFGMYGDYGGLTNCILTDCTNASGFSLCNSVLTNGPGIYQTVGGGGYYLATNSPYRDAGTTNIDPALLANLKTKTTYPPIVYTVPGVFFYTNLSLNPQAQRDTNAPDLGYHYDPLDYIFGPVYITNATITVNPGTAIAVYGTNSYTYGFALGDQASFQCQGLPNNLNRIMEFNTVQEQSPAGWKTTSYGLIVRYTVGTVALNCNFTDLSVLAQDAFLIQISGLGPFNFQNCQFHGGNIYSGYPTLNFTNCLFERVVTYLDMEDNLVGVFRNNLVFGGTIDYYSVNTNIVVRDNLFDRTVIPDDIGGFGQTYYGGNNAYVTNCDRLHPTYVSDIILPSPINYQIGPLGNYYQPTNSMLIDAGSTTADQVGLYDFTTQTNQIHEGTSIVDIGYHYVADNTDTNGDGMADTWEMYYFGTLSVDPNADPDGDGLTNLQEYQAGTNPTVDDSTVAASRLNYIYDAGGWLKTVSGKQSGFVNPDSEGNIQAVSQ